MHARGPHLAGDARSCRPGAQVAPRHRVAAHARLQPPEGQLVPQGPPIGARRRGLEAVAVVRRHAHRGAGHAGAAVPGRDLPVLQRAVPQLADRGAGPGPRAPGGPAAAHAAQALGLPRRQRELPVGAHVGLPGAQRRGHDLQPEPSRGHEQAQLELGLQRQLHEEPAVHVQVPRWRRLREAPPAVPDRSHRHPHQLHEPPEGIRGGERRGEAQRHR
mmetsp:Transcript_96859/g.250517  ORF Transcript_96859/g.250517 Transcript_96859/m.250517 type:complete len:217 (+) Transcript_96859:264-914(+)